MLYNYNYRLPVIRSTYKSNYGKGRKDIIPHDIEFYELKEYSLDIINKSIEVYDRLITRLHDISFSSLISFKEKSDKFKEIILEELNLIVENRKLDELDIVTIEEYFMDRKEKLEIIRSSKMFHHQMHIIAANSIEDRKRIIL